MLRGDLTSLYIGRSRLAQPSRVKLEGCNRGNNLIIILRRKWEFSFQTQTKLEGEAEREVSLARAATASANGRMAGAD